MADALWILVANASRARLFSTDERAEKWDLREELFHEESRQRSTELLNQPDNPNAGTLRKPSAENEPNGRQSLEHERFARQLAERLEQGLNERAYERLVIAAPPEFLGRLRKVISDRVHKHLMLDMRADFSNIPARELPDRIPLT
ncbi:host attachment protein [Archangium primigenium]|uniref:host attachment protein n=1 Tax=[Archangium] primigenium TaxID=2792470 RepID=UPI0019562093|nr:host attachment protein [Archangium primigenium]MBM7119196.1 host attachment protein [Archangium primigenium]